MPYSSVSGKLWTQRYIQRLIKKCRNNSILDVGAGAGNYSEYLRPKLKNTIFEGLEIWEPYITQFNLHSKYDRLFVEDARKFVPDKLYGITIMGDVLEHMTVEEAVQVYDKMLDSSEFVLISIPIIRYPQGEFMGNPHEIHVKEDWTHEEVMSTFRNIALHKLENEIGVYIGYNDKLHTREEAVQANKSIIAVYAICKNEEKFVDRWIKSVSEADMVIVVDTGSTDRTVKRLEEKGALVYQKIFAPWRFDAARNYALEQIPENVEICVSNDMDEVFDEGWRDKLEAVWQDGTTKGRYLFISSFNPDGTPQRQFAMEKIHSRHGYKWIRPVHEALAYMDPEKEKKIWIPGLVLKHYPDYSKPRSNYFPLLELSAEENPEDSQIIFWLGREYMYHKQYEKCIDTLQKYLKIPASSWDYERCAAMRFIARSYKFKSDIRRAKNWLYKAIAECPESREPYVEMAELGYELNQWHLVYHMTEEALKIKEKPYVYLVETFCWDYTIYDLGAIACYRLGLYEKSLDFARKALDMAPENERLKNNLKLIEEKAKETGTGV